VTPAPGSFLHAAQIAADRMGQQAVTRVSNISK